MQIGSFYIDPEQVARGVTLVVMAVGQLVIPILPGLVIIWLAALGYGLVAGFGVLGWSMFALITIFMVGGSIIDNVLMGATAYKEGAPWWAILLAMLGAIIGSFLIPIPIVGGILSALLVLFGIEYLRRKDWHKALTSMRGMLLGWGWAFIIRFIIGLIMIGLWLIWAWV